MFVTVNDVVGLPGLPGTVQGVRWTLNKRASNRPNLVRRREGTKAFEYHIDCLPETAQQAVRQRYFKQLMAEQPAETAVMVPKHVKRDPNQVSVIELCRKSPALMDDLLQRLTEHQRQVADARGIIAQQVLTLGQQPGFSCSKAIRQFVEHAKMGDLPPKLAQAVQIANAKKGSSRALSEITVKRWVAAFNQTGNAAEALLALAPGKRKPINVEEIAWLPDYLRHYRKANGVGMKEAWDDFSAEWNKLYLDDPVMLAVLPSYDSVRRAMARLPEIVKQRGRKTGSEYRQIAKFIRRDWCSLPVNYVWIGDGHGMKMKVAHPDHGQPFSPEVTFILDGSCRYITGWSLSLSENVIAVIDALRHGIAGCGKPFVYYSDNGGGETNKTLDADITGILTRLDIEHPTGIPGNPQGRGIIERLNRTLGLRIARRFATYYGTGADRETVRKTGKALKSALNAQSKGNALTVSQQNTLRKLPSWDMLIDEIKSGVEWYNNRPHSELPKRADGKHYSPAEFRRWKLENEDTELEWLTPFELRDMFMPQVERTVSRCEIPFINNIYYAPELANEHGRKVLISYDIHDAQKVIVRRLDGSYLCEAVWDGNKRLAFPVTAEYHNRQQRIKGMRKRGEEKVALAEAENNQTLPSPTENAPLPVNVYRSVGNVAVKQAIEIDEEEDAARQESFQRGVDWLAEQQKKRNPLI